MQLLWKTTNYDILTWNILKSTTHTYVQQMTNTVSRTTQLHVSM